ncbi:two-component system activity regulator YycH [Clostridium formicaceticum]|uniref:YycH protein n=1 Tax=Clostridium formicaceticum TaxID=1497 RepID=A0AAC9RM79_9CLOT|nr:two-component system activity regulator YycH [Clostridium formicaceticum]AOY75332.1 hypothetical protein BJL90_05100 [Clostridium formicaceticum]ARE89781.1 YycH protein [Clostridium formicaceticum]
MNREQTKTLILAMLIIMSIVFTQKIWFYSPIKILQSEASFKEQQTAKIIETRNQLIVPERAEVSFGNSYYTTISSDIEKIWEASKNILSQYFTEEVEVIPITLEKYKENSRLKSVELEFGKNIPSVLVASIFDTVDNKIVNGIKEIRKILIPSLNRGVIYIIGKDNNVFEVRTQAYQESRQLFNFLDELQSMNYIRYYPLFIDVENPTLMPLSYENPIPEIFVESQIDVTNETMITEKVKSFFDDNLDFVKTIKETSGAIVFMYGYGEKGVRINSRGRLEYSEEIGSISSSNVMTALDTAIEFILQQERDFPEGAYLKEIRQDNKGYYLGFGYRMNGLPVAFHSNNIVHPIEVEVYGNKVRYYRTFIRRKMNFPDAPIKGNVLLPQQIIEEHIDLLKNNYLKDNNIEEQRDDKEILSYIERNITKVEILYYDTVENNRNQLLEPAWRIKIAEREYYFNTYDGELLYSGLVN